VVATQHLPDQLRNGGRYADGRYTIPGSIGGPYTVKSVLLDLKAVFNIFLFEPGSRGRKRKSWPMRVHETEELVVSAGRMNVFSSTVIGAAQVIRRIPPE